MTQQLSYLRMVLKKKVSKSGLDLVCPVDLKELQESIEEIKCCTDKF